MLHRDVKTMNIFLSQREEGPDAGAGRQQAPVQFKLGDVGVSKVLEEGRSHASTVIGTPFYLSPELAQVGGRVKVGEGGAAAGLGGVPVRLCSVQSASE
jgi:serine/threonine protein kinase